MNWMPSFTADIMGSHVNLFAQFQWRYRKKKVAQMEQPSFLRQFIVTEQ